MTAEMQTVLDLLRSDFQGRNINVTGDVAREDVLNILNSQKLLMHTYRMGRCKFPKNWQSVMKMQAEQEEALYWKNKAEQQFLLQCFADENLQVYPIKGVLLNDAVYEPVVVRAGNDIDLLVQAKDVEKAHQILTRESYRQRVGASSLGNVYGAISQARRALLASTHHMIKSSEIPPVKRSANKPEYLPYIKSGCAAVELHDGLYYLNPQAMEYLFWGAISERGYFNSESMICPETILLVLLSNTYENSESFASNSFDYSMCLRDYADLRFFLKRFAKKINWEKLEEDIITVGLEKLTGTVLNNLNQIYNRELSEKYFRRIHPRKSEWRMDIISRICYPKNARSQAVHVQRGKWERAADENECEGAARRAGESAISNITLYGRKLRFDIYCENKELLITWFMDTTLLKNEKSCLLQLDLFPLNNQYDYLTYKLMIFPENGMWIAYAHKSGRFPSGTIRKKTGNQYPVTARDCGGSITLQVKVPYNDFIECTPDRENVFCIRPGMYYQVYQEIYHEADLNEAKMWKLHIQ